MVKKVMIGLLVTIMVVILGMFVWLKPKLDHYQQFTTQKLFSINEMTFKSKIDTQILDIKGEKIGEITNNRFVPINIGDAPSHLKNGYIAVEDKNFLSHKGYDPKAILRAGIAYLKNDGAITQGGSTITQQVLKNNLLTEIESKWDRKISELLLAPKIEQRLTKDQILEAYMNTNYYGNRCYGVGSASRFYFGKLTQDLTIEESAMLIGLSNSPSRYDPVKNYEESMEKVGRVLKTMLEENVISQTEYQNAIEKEIVIKQDRQGRKKESYPVSLAIHDATLRLMEQDDFKFEYIFEDKESEQLYKERYRDAYSKKSEFIRTGGLYIYTSIDQSLQAKAEQALEKELRPYTQRNKEGRYTLQASTTIIDNRTGMVKAVVGGRGEDEEYNRAFLSQRQPGSAIKPITVYTPAFETGKYYPSLVMQDQYNSEVKGAPRNYGVKYYGNINIRKAVSVSSNTIPFNIVQNEGVDLALTPLKNLHFTGLSHLDKNNGSLAVGGFTNGVTTLDMAKAYSTIANNGQYINRRLVTKILTQDQQLLVSPTGAEITDVFTPDSSWLMLDTLKGAVEDGTGNQARIPGVALSGKTGTANEDKDSWFCGATTDYAIATWVGYDMPRPLPQNVVSGSAMRITKDIVKILHPNGSKPFERPATVVQRNISASTGKPSDSNTGKKDYFSTLILDNIKRQKDEELKEKAIEQIEELKRKITNFEQLELQEAQDIVELDTQYIFLLNRIDDVKDEDLKIELTNQLKGYYDYHNTVSKYLRDEYNSIEQERLEAENQRAEQQRIRKEEESRVREQEEQNIKVVEAQKEEDIELNESLFLEALDNLRNYRYSEEPPSVLILDARNKLANCKKSKYYKSWEAELYELESTIELE